MNNDINIVSYINHNLSIPVRKTVLQCTYFNSLVAIPVAVLGPWSSYTEWLMLPPLAGLFIWGAVITFRSQISAAQFTLYMGCAFSYLSAALLLAAYEVESTVRHIPASDLWLTAAGYVLFNVLSLLQLKSRIARGVFVRKEKPKIGAVMASAGVLSGMGLARAFGPAFDQSTIVTVLVSLLMLFAFGVSLGNRYFLKYYYMVRFHFSTCLPCKAVPIEDGKMEIPPPFYVAHKRRRISLKPWQMIRGDRAAPVAESLLAPITTRLRLIASRIFKWALYGLLMAVLLWGLLGPVVPGIRYHGFDDRFRNIGRLATAIRQFEHQQGRMPPNLASIVPDHIGLQDAAVLYGPTNHTWSISAFFKKEAKSFEDIANAESDGPYAYLGWTNHSSSVVLFEKPSAFEEPLRVSQRRKVLVVFKDYSVREVPENHLKKWGIWPPLTKS